LQFISKLYVASLFSVILLLFWFDKVFWSSWFIFFTYVSFFNFKIWYLTIHNEILYKNLNLILNKICLWSIIKIDLRFGGE
jgi:hypothetical protein